MSDVPGGQGWWQASDGKWYPPQQPPAPQFTQPQKKHTVLKVIGGVFVLIIVLGIIGAALGSDTDGTSQGTSGDSSETTVKPADTKRDIYPNRPDKQKDDHEAAIGEEVRLSGYTTKVVQAGWTQQLDPYVLKAGYVTTTVTIANRDDKAQRYSITDWKIITPSGQVVDASFAGLADDKGLKSGDLVKGGTVTGDLAFEVGNTKGDYFIIYDPDSFSSPRGVWKVTV